MLIVNPNAVTARLATLQSLEAVAGRYEQVIQSGSRVQKLQPSLHHPPQVTRGLSSCSEVKRLAGMTMR